MIKNESRRNFLCNAPAAALVAGLALSDKTLLAEGVQDAPTTKFQLFTASELAADAKSVSGNKTIVETPTLQVIFTSESNKKPAEFEWHEGRDHVVQIMDGETIYEIGGTPEGGHITKPGEHLAPNSVGASKFTLRKGDMLTIPRGTPHKRTTPGSVALVLTSSLGMAM